MQLPSGITLVSRTFEEQVLLLLAVQAVPRYASRPVGLYPRPVLRKVQLLPGAQQVVAEITHAVDGVAGAVRQVLATAAVIILAEATVARARRAGGLAFMKGCP